MGGSDNCGKNFVNYKFSIEAETTYGDLLCREFDDPPPVAWEVSGQFSTLIDTLVPGQHLAWR
jgi:hypothetical protein